ncbi:hypothetical protein BT69DRAFT_592012 [Atractiella rhizophila]|nr:hypothetical protein BT69DRAFT_592012 [Atractiella rhizophila]
MDWEVRTKDVVRRRNWTRRGTQNEKTEDEGIGSSTDRIVHSVKAETCNDASLRYASIKNKVKSEVEIRNTPLPASRPPPSLSLSLLPPSLPQTPSLSLLRVTKFSITCSHMLIGLIIPQNGIQHLPPLSSFHGSTTTTVCAAFCKKDAACRRRGGTKCVIS